MDQQIGSDGGGHMTVVQAMPQSNNQVQVVQAGQVIQSANGQQIVVHAVPQNAGQPVHLGSQGNQPLQLLQLPVQVCVICFCVRNVPNEWLPLFCSYSNSHKRNWYKRPMDKRSSINLYKSTAARPLLTRKRNQRVRNVTS